MLLSSTIARGAVVLTLVTAACSSSKSRESAGDVGEPATPVRIRAVAQIERPSTIRASGAVEARTTSDLGFQVSGKVLQVPVREGDMVRAGQLLAAVDPLDYQLSLEQATISRQRAADEYARMQALHDRGSLAPNDYERFRSTAATSETQERAAAKRLSDTRLVAPFAGLVARRAIDPGETAAPGVPVLTIVDVDPVTVKVGVPEAEIGAVHLGATAEVALPALGGRLFTGHVRLIGVAADPASRTYTVEITVANPDRVLLPGMVAEASIRGQTMERAITIPGEAIVRDADGATLAYVYFPEQKRVYARRVTVSSVLDREVVVSEGLTAGEMVVIGGQHQVREGELVTASSTSEDVGSLP